MLENLASNSSSLLSSHAPKSGIRTWWPYRVKVKVKYTLVQAVRLCTGRKANRGSRDIALHFHDHGTRRGWGVSVTLLPLFTPRKTRYPLYRKLGGPHSRSGQVRKISPSSGFDPRTVQPVASRYTDYATRPTRHYKTWQNSAEECSVMLIFLLNTCFKIRKYKRLFEGDSYIKMWWTLPLATRRNLKRRSQCRSNMSTPLLVLTNSLTHEAAPT